MLAPLVLGLTPAALDVCVTPIVGELVDFGGAFLDKVDVVKETTDVTRTVDAVCAEAEISWVTVPMIFVGDTPCGGPSGYSESYEGGQSPSRGWDTRDGP